MRDQLAESTGAVSLARFSVAAGGEPRLRPAPRVSVDAPVEVVAPDRSSALALLELAGGTFAYELVGAGTSWAIRLLPSGRPAWEEELLVLLERWLETCPLPCATIVSGGRRYVFRSALTRTEVPDGRRATRVVGRRRTRPAPTAGMATS